jgi:hypothetical protein
MCQGTSLEEWQAICLKNLLATGFIDLELVIINSEPGIVPPVSNPKNTNAGLNRALFRFYRKFISSPRSTRMMDTGDLLSTGKQVRFKPVHDVHRSQHLTDVDCGTIARYDLDIILKFGFGAIHGRVLQAARHGVWAFLDSEEITYGGVPGSFREIYDNKPVTQGTLIKLEDSFRGAVLKKGFLPTCNHSYRKNTDRLFFESAKWPAQLCRIINRDNTKYLECPEKIQITVSDPPGNLQMSVFIFKILKNLAGKAWKALFFRDQWNIAVISEPIHKFLTDEASSYTVKWAPRPPSNKFLADPFGIIKGENLTILCEEFDNARKRGVIASITLDGKGEFSTDHTVIDSPFHMSYPYLLQDENKIYCVPETFEARAINLFRAEDFPEKWIRASTILPGIPAVDPTIFYFQGLWWLMHTDEEQGPNLNLFAWYAGTLGGPWKPHLRNPIKTDIRSSRPGGTPFVHNGMLYRPAQDCSKTYGGRIALNRVLTLNPQDFAEETVRYVEPYPGSIFNAGLHTLSSAGNITIIDGKRLIFNLTKLLPKIKHPGKSASVKL